MLGNIIGGFIVILVGTTLNKKLVLIEETQFETAEFRLKPRDGQDRSVNVNSYARTTDKAYFPFSIGKECKIYSLCSNYNQNKKLEINNSGLLQSLNRLELHKLMET